MRDLTLAFALSTPPFSSIYLDVLLLRQGSNELDTFLLTRGKHCQAGLPLFEPCLNKIIQYLLMDVGAALMTPVS